MSELASPPSDAAARRAHREHGDGETAHAETRSLDRPPRAQPDTQPHIPTVQRAEPCPESSVDPPTPDPDRRTRPNPAESSTQCSPQSSTQSSTQGSTLPPSASPTTAGSTIAGRYRLLERVGSDTAAAAEFWQAEDTVLRRPVAVTLLRKLPTIEAPEGRNRAEEMIARGLRTGSFEHEGCARLLDVVGPGSGDLPSDLFGAAVTEWVPGRSLAEVVSDGIVKPMAAARAVAPLAAAAEAAHRTGLVLGCDHPQRVRVTPDGRAQLCFALPRPDFVPADDVRGLGAVLHSLLTARWPLSVADAARAGLRVADRGPDGELVLPSAQRPGVPVELDTLARGTLEPDPGRNHVHTAAAVHRLLSEIIDEDDRTALFPPAHDGVPAEPDDVWQERQQRAPSPDPERKRKLTIGLSALGVAMLVVLGYLGVQVGSVFSGDGGVPPIVVGAATDPQAGDPPPAGTTDGGPVAVAGVEVYVDGGDKDNEGRVSRVIDGKPQTSWKTVSYRQQLPAIKPGIGVVMSFASAVQLSTLTITSPSAGTVVEIRSAPEADSPFDETTLVTTATLRDGRTDISLAGSQPTSHVLVWLTKLSGGGSDYSSEIGEISFERAG